MMAYIVNASRDRGWWQMLQAISVIHADNMIRVAIRRALGYRHGYSHKTGYFVFRVALRPRIMQSTRDIALLAQSIISIVARIASWNEPYHYYGFRAPGAVSVMTRRNPKGELPLCQAIFTGGSITYPAHSGHILCLVYSRMPFKYGIIEPEYDRVW